MRTEGVAISLDETDVGLDDWSEVLDPMSLRLFVVLYNTHQCLYLARQGTAKLTNVTASEVLDVVLQHAALMVVRSECNGVLQVVGHVLQVLREISVHDADLNARVLVLHYRLSLGTGKTQFVH